MLYDKKWDAKIEVDTVKTALERAREILKDEARWNKGCWAKAADGRPLQPEDPEFSVAKSFCISGAIYVAAGNEPIWNSAVEFLRTIECSEMFPGLWNDARHRTHADVLALLDKAIAARG